MQEMMQGHPDPADDSTPHSLPNGKGDYVNGELSDNMTQNDNQQHGGLTSVGCQFLQTSPTQSSEALPIVKTVKHAGIPKWAPSICRMRRKNSW